MSPAEPTPNPRIELDLGGQDSIGDAQPRHLRHVSQQTMPPAPKVEAVLKETDIGSDEAERTVAIFFLLSAVPGVLSMLLGHGAGGLFGILIPIYFGIGLLRGDDFVHQWVVAACIVQLIVGPLSALASPRSIVFILGGVLESVGLLVLVSGKALSRQAYQICLGVVGLGIVMELVGSFIR